VYLYVCPINLGQVNRHTDESYLYIDIVEIKTKFRISTYRSNDNQGVGVGEAIIFIRHPHTDTERYLLTFDPVPKVCDGEGEP